MIPGTRRKLALLLPWLLLCAIFMVETVAAHTPDEVQQLWKNTLAGREDDSFHALRGDWVYRYGVERTGLPGEEMFSGEVTGDCPWQAWNWAVPAANQDGADRLWLRRFLPEKPFPDKVLLLADLQCDAMAVFLDGKPIYASGAMLPGVLFGRSAKRLHWIPLPSDSGGQALQLFFYANQAERLPPAEPIILYASQSRDCFQEITERFLVPLGLTQTTPADRRDLSGLAAGYIAADNPFGFPEKTTSANGVLLWHPGLEWTGGGWVSTSKDLARWGAALFGGRALAEEALAEMLRAVPISLKSDAVEYGAGVAIYRSGPYGPVYGHGGWIPGYSSSLRYYPQHGVTVALQINTDIGIVDGGSAVVGVMENRLAGVVIAYAGKNVA